MNAPDFVFSAETRVPKSKRSTAHIWGNQLGFDWKEGGAQTTR